MKSTLIQYVIAASIGLLAGWLLNGTIWDAKHAKLQAQHSDQIAAANARALQISRDWALAMENLQNEHEQKLQKLEADFAAADAVNGRLRRELDEAANRAARDTTSAQGCRRAATATRVFSELLGETNRLAGIYAEDNQRVRLSLRTCNDSRRALIQELAEAKKK